VEHASGLRLKHLRPCPCRGHGPIRHCAIMVVGCLEMKSIQTQATRG
jgi:hypothetical protein